MESHYKKTLRKEGDYTTHILTGLVAAIVISVMFTAINYAVRFNDITADKAPIPVEVVAPVYDSNPNAKM